MQRFNISVPREYESKGEKKTAWSTVGTLVMFPPKEEGGAPGFILELGMFPSTTFKVFPQEQKDRAPKEEKEW